MSYMIRDAFGRPIVYNDYAHGGTDYYLLNDGLDAIGDGPDRFVFAGTDQPIAWYDNAGTRHFLHADERGSIVAVSDSSGALTGINRYDDYGQAQGALVGKFGYTGQRYMSFTGLYDYRNRAYDPEQGRFMQADPIGYADSPNLYAYVLNDPVNLVDPLGLCPPSTNEMIWVCTNRIDVPRGGLPAPSIGGVNVAEPNEPRERLGRHNRQQPEKSKPTPDECRSYVAGKDGPAIGFDILGAAAEFALPEFSATSAVIGALYVGAGGFASAMSHRDYGGAALALVGRHAGAGEGFVSGKTLRLARFISVGALLLSTTRDIQQAKSDYQNCLAGKEGP